MPKQLTCTQLYERMCRAFRHAMGARRALTCAAHAATNGDSGLVHNWGNQEAIRLEAHVWARWRRYDAAYLAAYSAAQHREHEAEGRVGAYLWCEHCKPFRDAYDRAQQQRNTCARRSA
jgi:hypothetical protein